MLDWLQYTLELLIFFVGIILAKIAIGDGQAVDFDSGIWTRKIEARRPDCGSRYGWRTSRRQARGLSWLRSDAKQASPLARRITRADHAACQLCKPRRGARKSRSPVFCGGRSMTEEHRSAPRARACSSSFDDKPVFVGRCLLVRRDVISPTEQTQMTIKAKASGPKTPSQRSAAARRAKYTKADDKLSEFLMGILEALDSAAAKIGGRNSLVRRKQKSG